MRGQLAHAVLNSCIPTKLLFMTSIKDYAIDQEINMQSVNSASLQQSTRSTPCHSLKGRLL